MKLDDFQALLRLLPTESIEDYQQIVEEELARRHGGAFNKDLWSSKLLDAYKEATVLNSIKRLRK